MMLNTNGSISLGQDIYLYKNFITPESADRLFNIAKNSSPEIWNPQFDLKMNPQHYVTNYFGEAQFIYEAMKDFQLSSGDLVLSDSVYLQKYHAGQGMAVHYDNNKVEKQIEIAKNYKDGDEFEVVKEPVYGIVVYLNKVDGGELFYENQGVVYSPSPGDMIIHSAEKHCSHGVNKLISDLRVVYSSMIYREIKVPILVN
jgi:hypothetical protein